ncbi:hypothetical protein A3A39_04680 [Candidatus Kaiserbacteria bacterium RIFCSPLOWO2_01_FULL_54_13]|uniref:Uncharacterized protein n=1 Tax=Candidatus Kaiserbacteria bacterium RIFCSPLOWO2_01_FULL_54_13 TaxID=1798512 RepID=A0A1F6F1Z0_9BACT|nr:MAG: hypothetical protein A3A39_04680 [Candidatus Kaiserbacteria bacterium RIFCSPLOWO2_01_FULL_54_13]
MATEQYRFEKYRSKKDTVTVSASSIEEEWLGRGRYADVVRAPLKVEYVGRERIVTLALKKYKDRKDVDVEFLRNLQKTYDKCRGLGLPVLPTFRLDPKKRTVATTDWTENKTYDVGGYGNVHESEGTKKIARINNVGPLAKSIFSAAVTAARNKLEIAGDAYYFRFPKTGGEVYVNFAIGDVDGIIDPPVSSEESPELARYNLESAHYALYWWLRNHLPHDEKIRDSYLKQIKEMYEEQSRSIQ